MIKTIPNQADQFALLELGYKFHQESQFRDTPYDEDRVLQLIQAPATYPSRYLIAFDDQYRGVIILQMGSQFFSGLKWAGDQVFYVVPEERGSGLAKELLDVGTTWATENGAHDLVIFHNAGLKMPSFYEREGFKQSGLILNKSL